MDFKFLCPLITVLFIPSNVYTSEECSSEGNTHLVNGRNCTENDTRLVGPGGNNGSSGRVEVCLSGLWGTVCDDGWDNNDATALCRQLGYNDIVRGIPTREAYFGEGSGPIHLTNAQCRNDDTNLLNCDIDKTGVNGCTHSEDAGVICRGTSRCGDGDVRLVGGKNEREGRVEICYNGVWGTVCDNDWDEVDASVVCTQLGYGQPVMTLSRLGAGEGPVLLSNINCNRNSTILSQCVHQEDIGSQRCHADNTAGVRCSTTTGSSLPAVIGGVFGALVVLIIAIIVTVAVVLIVRAAKRKDIANKGSVPEDNLVEDKDVVYNTAILKDFQNPIYSAPCPDTTQNPYEGVYSEIGTSKVGDTVNQKADGSAPGAVTNTGGENSVGDIHLYSAMESQHSSTPKQEQIPRFDDGYSHLQHK